MGEKLFSIMHNFFSKNNNGFFINKAIFYNFFIIKKSFTFQIKSCINSGLRVFTTIQKDTCVEILKECTDDQSD